MLFIDRDVERPSAAQSARRFLFSAVYPVAEILSTVPTRMYFRLAVSVGTSPFEAHQMWIRGASSDYSYFHRISSI